jgi:hypothetical protein
MASFAGKPANCSYLDTGQFLIESGKAQDGTGKALPDLFHPADIFRLEVIERPGFAENNERFADMAENPGPEKDCKVGLHVIGGLTWRFRIAPKRPLHPSRGRLRPDRAPESMAALPLVAGLDSDARSWREAG